MERFLDYCCEGRDLYLNDGDARRHARAGRWWRVMLEEHCPDLFLRVIGERRGHMARAAAALKEKEKEKEAEAEASGLTQSGTPIEARADDWRPRGSLCGKRRIRSLACSRNAT
jgi:hypothetical protein